MLLERVALSLLKNNQLKNLEVLRLLFRYKRVKIMDCEVTDSQSKAECSYSHGIGLLLPEEGPSSTFDIDQDLDP